MSISAALALAKKYSNGGAVETHPPMRIKKHINFQGLQISIETPKGEIRRGTNSNGKAWANRMAADYGYIKRTEGKDGDQVDAFVGPNKRSNKVFVIDQLHHSIVRFDEHKCLLGFNTEKQALTAYHNSYGRKYGSHHTVGAVTEMSVDAFKEWLKGGGGKKPISPEVPKYKRGGAAKATKATAHYRLGTQAEHCGICTMFRAPDSCTSVLGKIRWMDNCDYFEKIKKYQEGGAVEEPFEAGYPEPEVSDEDLARAQIARETAPREGGLMQTVPQFAQMVQTPEGRSKLWEATKTAASEFIPGMIEQAKLPGEAIAGKITPEQEAEWGAGTALGIVGGASPFAKPGTVGIAGGRPPGKPGPEAVHYWKQAIVDQLIERHGERPEQISEALNKIRETASPEAENVVLQGLPEQMRIDVMRHRMEQWDQPRQGEPGAPPPAFREITHPEEAKDWLRERGHNPEDWGYSDPENYVELANKMKRQEMGLVPPPAPERTPVRTAPRQGEPDYVETGQPSGGAPTQEELYGTPSVRVTHVSDEDLLNKFFNQVSPSEVKHLSSDELLNVHGALGRVSDPYSYESMNPEVWNALHNSLDALNRRIDEHMTWKELERLTSPEQAAPVRQEPQVVSAGPFASTYDPHAVARFTEYFNQVLAPHFGNQEEFARSYFGGMKTDRISARVGVDPYGSGSPAFYFDGPLYHPNGDVVGSTERMIIPEQKYAYHGLLSLEPKYQSGEVAPRTLRNQIDLYKTLDLNYVKLNAGLSSGPYSWAKYGWIPDAYSWNNVRQEIKHYVTQNQLKISDPEIKQYLMNVLDDRDPRAIWALSDITAKDDFGNEIGRVALLGRRTRGAVGINFPTSGWSGQLNLKNAESMERFDAFYKRQIEKAGKKPKFVTE